MNYEHIKIYSDGGARGNPGPAAIGVVIKAGDEIVEQISEYIGETTNNQAEYQALLSGLKAALKHEPEVIECFLDSELVVKQLNGQYKVKNKELLPIYQEIVSLVANKKVTFTHVLRQYNQTADKLVNEALDKKNR